MKNFFVMLTVAFLLAPAQHGIAINYETKECAGYWEGDEFTYYTLPEEWVEYYPDENGLIQTETGSCNYGWNYGNTDVVKSCCKELGYTYISENIGKDLGQQIITTDDLPISNNRENYFSLVIIVVGSLALTVLGYYLSRELKKK